MSSQGHPIEGPTETADDHLKRRSLLETPNCTAKDQLKLRAVTAED
jgi:hypothetical protein